MSATRTQVYLTEEQRQRIDALAEAEGVTMAEIVRRALDVYLGDEVPDPELALATTFGAAPDATMPSRDEWDRG
jgi:predicted DNA-binding protein